MALEEEQGATADLPEVEQVSMDDTIANTLRDINARSESTEGDSNSTNASPEAPEEAAARIRDQQGKFSKPETAAEGTGLAATAAAPDAAPNTWKKDAAAQWATLPPAARAEIQRREADFHKGIEGYKEAAGFGQAMQRAIQPHMQTIQALGVTPDVAIGELMKADHALRYGQPHEKVAFLTKLAQDYGIDTSSLNQHLANQAAIPPEVRAIQDENARLRAQFNQQNTMAQRQQEDALNSEISTFAAEPSHSHFESVKGHMSALLQAGQAKDLADAYEQAVYANPTTRALMLQQQQTEALAAKTKSAQAARTAASVNVARRPAIATAQPIGTMDDTIRDTLRRLQNA